MNAVEAAGDGRCDGCGHGFHIDRFVWSWGDGQAETRKRDIWGLIRRQLNPVGSRLSPLRYFSDWRVERYYRRTLSDRSLADGWAQHYLQGLKIEPGATVLDHGCGRGRNAALLVQLGFDVAAQDVQAHSWWHTIRNCRFQQVPATAPCLPWIDNTFSLALDIGVLHFLDETQLTKMILEVHRVLAPGGYWLLLEPNADSYGASVPRRYCGRLHPFEHVRRLVLQSGFQEIDHSYEGLYTPVAPCLVNFIRKQACPRPFTVEDFDSRLAAMIPARRRAHWLLRVQKPARDG